jgi:hypothetical protein
MICEPLPRTLASFALARDPAGRTGSAVDWLDRCDRADAGADIGPKLDRRLSTIVAAVLVGSIFGFAGVI